jgi:pentatricopeptide repeat protein
VNYLLSTCATAKLPVLAYETVLKYSGSESHSEKLTLWKTDRNHSSIQDNINNMKQGSSVQNSNSAGHVDVTTVPPKKLYSLPTLAPDSYDIALKACGSSGDLATAYKITKLMKSKRISMTTDCWNSVLNAVRTLYRTVMLYNVMLCYVMLNHLLNSTVLFYTAVPNLSTLFNNMHMDRVCLYISLFVGQNSLVCASAVIRNDILISRHN